MLNAEQVLTIQNMLKNFFGGALPCPAELCRVPAGGLTVPSDL